MLAARLLARYPVTFLEMRALLIDDDRDLAQLLTEYFTPHGVTLDHAEEGKAGIAKLRAGTYDVVLLDVMLPGADGFAVCAEIRGSFEVPIIMLTARGDDADRIVGLELGADDYVPKPYNPRELLARMKAVHRRTKPVSAAEKFQVGELEIDAPAHRVRLKGEEVQLTSFEFRLLLELARRAGQTVPREELAKAVKGGEYDPSVDRSLDVHVSHLRQKLEDDAHDPRRIRTVRGVGYVLVRSQE